MAGYILADVEVTDSEMFAEYRKMVSATVEQYGGRYVVRGGDVEVMEGDFEPNRTVVIEFDSVERAHEWYDSPEYAPAKQLRFKCANTNLLIADGD